MRNVIRGERVPVLTLDQSGGLQVGHVERRRNNINQMILMNLKRTLQGVYIYINASLVSIDSLDRNANFPGFLIF